MKTILHTTLITAFLSNTVYAGSPVPVPPIFETSVPAISKETTTAVYKDIQKQKVPTLTAPTVFGILSLFCVASAIKANDMRKSSYYQKRYFEENLREIDRNPGLYKNFYPNSNQQDKALQLLNLHNAVFKYGGIIIAMLVPIFLGISAYKFYKRHQIKKQNAKRAALKAESQQAQLVHRHRRFCSIIENQVMRRGGLRAVQ